MAVGKGSDKLLLLLINITTYLTVMQLHPSSASLKEFSVPCLYCLYCEARVCRMQTHPRLYLLSQAFPNAMLILISIIQLPLVAAT